jgi:hypothetical protein
MRQSLGVNHCDSKHKNRKDLMRERESERRLIEQRDDTETRLQCYPSS